MRDDRKELTDELEETFLAELARARAGYPPDAGRVLRIAREAVAPGGGHPVAGTGLKRLISLAAAARAPGEREAALSAAVELLGAMRGNFNLLWNSVSLLRPFAYTGSDEFEQLARCPELSLATVDAVGSVLARSIHAAEADGAEAECRVLTEELARVFVGLGVLLHDRGLALPPASDAENVEQPVRAAGSAEYFGILFRYGAEIAALPEKWRGHAIENLDYNLAIDLRYEPRKVTRSMDLSTVRHYLRLWSFLPGYAQTVITVSDPEVDRQARRALAELRSCGARVAHTLRELVQTQRP